MNDNDSNIAAEIEFGITYRRILGYLKPFIFYFGLAILGYLLFALSQPAFAMLMERFIDALSEDAGDGIYVVPLACVAIAFMRGVGSYLGGYYMAKVSENMVHAIRCALFKNITELPIAYFDKNKSGRLVALFTYNTNVMTTTVAGAVTTIIREGLTVIALFSYLFYQNFRMTLIFLLLGPPVAVLIRWVGKKIKVLGHGIQNSVGELNHVVAEVFSGIRLVKSVTAERNVSSRFYGVSDTTRRIGLKLAKVNSIYSPFMQMLIVIAMAVVMYMVLLARDTMTPAALIAYITAAAILPKPIRSLSGVHPQLLQGVVAATEVFRHIDMEKEQDNGTVVAQRLDGEIAFDDVSFAYSEGGENVLNKVSFSMARGQVYALVGKSGGGKSTLVNLIPRYYLPSSGKIIIDGVDIQDFTLDSLRANIATVSQNVTLFNTTVKENIAFGIENYSIDEVESAAIAANADEFIRELPNGYETIIGENGVLLSGGQRQRIAIARAVLRNSPILILDEATSALDNESEVKVQAALERVMKNRTTLVIAHRLSTVEHADVILVLDGGEIVERGSHAELMASGGMYSRMVQRDFS